MSYRKLGRTSSQRKALLRDLTTDLIMNESITTTEARAKEVRSTTEKMITLGKKGTLAARRQAAAFIRDEIADVREEDEKVVVQTVLQKLFSDVAPRYAERNGGYTQIYKTMPRRGDGAPMVVLKFVD
ncbi:50S ribosomal protein L17 [Loigolactobacillus coryniformis]|jgi:large subunit ribosomal protein L17|uniref:Large ribosomal subunit protein bL17 n=4 Tax=Loigolactobacillus coryniformis TaxID=1610 RepID=J3JB45_9LACO|nr:50S ribosomal protein L17 [Loigolactobacillus coryniformis]MDT3391244.1 50S ribosomal protein L17 [Bacillota bacterium]OEH89821.1 50S ribosomal protein L17 [Loigolactobacillus coryniformis subsp. coryniformis]RRG06094.1 MAG: 50S ribosomal protein L17 [Lactobacillus sp.]ATO43020.1 50S ribosomal protein L17 [Loigolactobacillus coryniformis subsp. torquens DSM 20004 = KCTC 3535]ATO54772.1 50S ribosomal protein L17 [Loigolactobacillus coryniformis subsp. coryniformis KCTC 3167 = DSM 20001]